MLSCNVVFASDLLLSLGVNMEVDNTNSVTRGEFANILAGILNGGTTPAATDGIFSDVTAKDAFSGSVYHIYNMGLISGYGNSTFGPNDPILTEQAVKILVSALGYDVIALSKGGYPAGYISVADSIDLLDGISLQYGEDLNYDTACALFENAVTCSLLIQTGFGSNEEYSSFDDRTLLTEYMKLKLVKGIITDNGITALTGSSAISEDMVLISGRQFKTGTTNAQSLLGCEVEAYVSELSSGNGEIKYIKISDDCVISRIPARRLMTSSIDYSMTNITYEDVYGNERKEKVDAYADYIYNGKAHPDLKLSDLKFNNGEIVLIDNDGDKVNEVMLVKSALVVVVDAINIGSEAIYDKNSNEIIVLKDKEIVDVIIDGNIAKFTDLKEWDALHVYKSIDGQYIEIDASSLRKSGVVNEITSIGTIEVDGEYFTVPSSTLLNSLKLGQEYNFSIDCTGCIIGIVDIGVGKAAYFLEAKITTGMDKALLLRAYTDDGEFKIFEFDKNAQLDGKSLSLYGTSYEDGINKVALKLNNDASGKLVMYELNGDKKIKSLTIPLADTDYDFDDESVTAFRVDFPGGEKLRYRNEQMTFVGKVNIDNRTTVFVIPQDLSDEENYSVIAATDIVRNMDYYPVAYSVGKPDGVSEYIVYNNDSDLDNASSKVILVDKITTISDSEGQTVQKLVGYSYRGEETFISKTNTTFSSVNAGDVIRCSTDKTGKVAKFDMVYDHNEQTGTGIFNTGDAYYDTIPASYFMAESRIIFGNVYYRYGDILGLVSSAPGTDTQKSDIENQRITGAPVYLVQTSERDKIVQADVNNINDYMRTGSSYSKVLIYCSNAAVRLVVVYK